MARAVSVMPSDHPPVTVPPIVTLYIIKSPSGVIMRPYKSLYAYSGVQ